MLIEIILEFETLRLKYNFQMINMFINSCVHFIPVRTTFPDTKIRRTIRGFTIR